MRFLEKLKLRVDREAEAVRKPLVTPGDGQVLEYVWTALEALDADKVADPLDPADFPMLEAERLAQIDAGLPDPTLRGVVSVVLAEYAAWKNLGADIKRVRRTAKLRLDQASSPAEARQIASPDWPT